MDTIYFDNAATTFPKPEEVYTFMDKFYRENGVNVGRGQYKLASDASKLVNETRELLLDLFHCENKKVVFSHTATEAINIILQGLPIENNWNIYISPFEHNAVLRTLHYLRSMHSFNLHILDVDIESMEFNINKIEEKFKIARPNLMVINHASNVCGVIAPINELCNISKQYGCINVIDMCQTAGLIDTDLSSNNIDFAVFAGHKTLYGPLGIAGFISGVDSVPTPLIYGGTGLDSANRELPNVLPDMFEVGSQNILSIAGLNAALKWIKKTGIDKIYSKEKEKHKMLLELLKMHPDIKIVGQTNDKNCIGVVSCTFDGYSCDEIGRILNDNNIAVRTGLQCAPMAHEFLGTYPAGTVRFSVGFFNTTEEIEILKDIFNKI